MSQAELAQIVSLLQQGNLQAAEALCHAVLEDDATNPDAFYYLGAVANLRGQQDEALSRFDKAISLDSGKGLFWYGKAVVYQQRKLVAEAIESYRQAIAAQPDLFEARFNLAGLLREAQPNEAESHYLKLLESQPKHRDVLNQLGGLARRRGLMPDAIEYYRRALEVDPQFAEASNNLGIIFQDQNRLDESVEAFEQALSSRPDIPELHNNLGNVLKIKGQLEKAEACYREAIRLNPGYASPYRNLGLLLRGVGQIEPAISHLRQALSVSPDSIETLLDLADTLLMQNHAQEAVELYERAFSIAPRPAIRIKLARVLPRIYESLAELEAWRDRFTRQFERLAQSPIRLHNPLTEVGAANFYLAYHGLDNRALHEQVARLFASADPWKTNVCDYAEKGVSVLRNLKPRIGFLSTYFLRGHTIAKLYAGFIEKLSNERFEVFAYLPEGKARLEVPAHVTSRCFNPENLARTAELVGQDKLDALFYPDIGMEPLTYFMGFHRLAPVQCVSWGHPDTTGISSIDYFISSRLLEPENAQSYYTERLALLDTLPVYYHRPVLEEETLDREYFGFSTMEHVYLCPQSLFKFHPEFDALLAQILREDPHGRLVLVNANYPEWGEMLLARFQRTMPDVAHRIKLFQRLGRREFFSLLMLADVALDTIHFGGGNTTYETLAFGTPIVTLPQTFMRSRVTYGCYQKMGITDMVVGSAREYIDKAVRLGGDRDYRMVMRQQILTRNHLLYEDMDAVRQLEEFFLEVIASGAGSR